MTDDTLVLRSPGRAERTRRALASAALNRLRADGSFTTEEVAADAGVSLATVYNRFPEGRDGLMAGAFGQVDFIKYVVLSPRFFHRDTFDLF